MLERQLDLWLIGDLEYRDVFGGKHVTSFSWIFHPGQKAWIEEHADEAKAPWFAESGGQPAHRALP